MDENKKPVSEFAIASLVIGLLAFISLGGIEKAIAAIVFGALAFKRMDKNEQLSGRRLAKAGIIISIFSIIIMVTFIVKFYPKIKERIEQLQKEEVLKTNPAPSP